MKQPHVAGGAPVGDFAAVKTTDKLTLFGVSTDQVSAEPSLGKGTLSTSIPCDGYRRGGPRNARLIRSPGTQSATVFHNRSIGDPCVTIVTDIRNDPCNDTDIVVIIRAPHKQVPKGG